MPKQVRSADIAEWRRLRAEGKSFSQIARLTGWQGRTVRKHLDADIRSGEAQQIRRELFKDRLGRHWDMLIEGVLAGLGPTGSIFPEDVLRSLDAAKSTQVETAGLRIEPGGDTGLSVQVVARDVTEWGLLGQHIPRDPLWAAVRAYEQAVEKELNAHIGLKHDVAEELQAALGVSVAARLGETPGLASTLVLWAYGEVLRPDAPSHPLTEDEVHESSSGQMKVRDTNRAAFLPGRKAELVLALNEVVSKNAHSHLVNGTLAERTRRCYLELRRVMDHTRLLTYLPGVCEVCARIEV